MVVTSVADLESEACAGSPPWKSRRRFIQPEPILPELLEPTDSLQQRLRFVNSAGSANDANAEACVSAVVGQIKDMGMNCSDAPVLKQPSGTEAVTHQPVDGSSGNKPGDQTHIKSWSFCVEPGGSADIHTTEEDGWQIVDTYGEKTPPRVSPSPSPERDLILSPSTSAPSLSREDTPEHFQWLVANISYPHSTYNVSVDTARQQIVIRTNNKKYFKRIDVPDLVEKGVQLENRALSWRHFQSTLIVSYQKPKNADQLA